MDRIQELFSLDGKVALVTGASSGLGRRFSQILAMAGARVAVASRREDALETTVGTILTAGGDAIAVPMDITDPNSIAEGIERTVDAFGKIDILVNNAGKGVLTPVVGRDDESMFKAWDDAMTTNTKSMWMLIRKVVAHMIEEEIEGNIINVSSINGGARPGKGTAAYAAAKAAVTQLTKALVEELADHRIRINAIAPGLFHTESTEQVISKVGHIWRSKIPISRIAEPEDLDAALLYLASNKASWYATGSVLTIDGGLSAGVITMDD